METLAQFCRWLCKMIYENLYFLLCLVVTAGLLLVPQIWTVLTEIVEVPFIAGRAEGLWAIGFVLFLVVVGALCLASVFVVVAPQWVKADGKLSDWSLTEGWPDSWSRKKVLGWSGLLALSAVALVPLVQFWVPLTQPWLAWCILPLAVFALAAFLAPAVGWTAGWLVALAKRLNRRGRLIAALVLLGVGAITCLVGASGLGSRWYPLAGSACRQSALWLVLAGGWFALSTIVGKDAPEGGVQVAPGRVLGWLALASLLGEAIWFVATRDVAWLGVSYRLYTIWGVLQTASVIVVLGAMLDAWQRASRLPMRLFGVVVLLALFLMFWAPAEPLTSAAEAVRDGPDGSSNLAETDAQERSRWYDHLIARLEAVGDEEPVVIVAASGGGSRAAIFAGLVLEELSREPLGNTTWGDHIVLTSSVSGGSLANAYYLHRLADPDMHLLQTQTDLRNSVQSELLLRMREQAKELAPGARRKLDAKLRDLGEPPAPDDEALSRQGEQLLACLKEWEQEAVHDAGERSCAGFQQPRTVAAWQDLGQSFEVWAFYRDFADRKGEEIDPSWVLTSGFMDGMCTDFMAPVVRGAVTPWVSRGETLRNFWTLRFRWHASNSRLGYDFRAKRSAAETNFGWNPNRIPVGVFNATDVGRGTRVAIGFPPVPPELFAAAYPTVWPDSKKRPRTVEEADPARKIALADAVAMSANFPWGFNVIRLSDKGKSWEETNEAPVMHVTDGGVVDNTGIDTVFEILRGIKRIADFSHETAKPGEFQPDALAVAKCCRIMCLLGERRLVLLEIDSGAKPGQPGLFSRAASVAFEPLNALNNAGYSGAVLALQNYMDATDKLLLQQVDLSEEKELLRQAPPGTNTRAWLSNLEKVEAAGIPTFRHIQYICNHADEGNVLTAWSLGPDDKASLLLRFLVERQGRLHDLEEFRDQDKVKVRNVRDLLKQQAHQATLDHLQYAQVEAQYAAIRKNAQTLHAQIDQLAKQRTEENLSKAKAAVVDEQKKLECLQRLTDQLPDDAALAGLKARLNDAARELDTLKTALAANNGPALDKALEDFPKKYVIPGDFQHTLKVSQQKNVPSMTGEAAAQKADQVKFEQRAKQTRQYFEKPASGGTKR